MSAGPGQDRLAVWTYEEAGEEIPLGDPSVTDAERSAAGRQTIADRFAALLPGNRSRAAEQFAAPGLPEGEDMVRVWQPRDPAELRIRLNEPPLAVWAEGDVLHVLWQGRADEVQLYGGVQPRLWPVEGADDLWEVSLRTRRLDEAVISMVAARRLAGGDWPTQIPDTRVWRGPKAPAAAPSAEPLRGTVERHALSSSALGSQRQVTVYRPPGPARAPVPSSPASGGPPSAGRSGFSGPGLHTVTRNGSAVTTRCGGRSGSPSRWAGCCRREARRAGPTAKVHRPTPQ